MSFDPFGFSLSPFLNAPAGFLGYGLLAFYILSLFAALFVTRADWVKLHPLHWFGLILLVLAGFALSQLFVLHFEADVLPPPGQISDAPAPGLALLVLVPAFFAGGWLGIGPALIVGLITGLGRALWESYSVFTPFEFAFIAGAVAAGLRQDYFGRLPRALRHPAISGTVLGILLAPFLLLSYFVSVIETAELTAVLDYVVSIFFAAAPIFITQALVAGIIAELASALWPGWPKRRGTQPPPYLLSLNRKLLFALIPLFLAGIILLFVADITIATRVSTDLVLAQLGRAAKNAGEDIPFFVQTGSNLLREIADRQDWFEGDNLTQTAGLLQSMQALPFFNGLILLDEALQPVATYPREGSAGTLLDAEQHQLAELVLTQNIPQNTLALSGDTPIEMVFMAPVEDRRSGQIAGVLVGRTQLVGNPLMQSVINNLSDLMSGQGLGFILDENDVVIYHPEANMMRGVFTPGAVESVSQEFAPPVAGARAYQDRAENGTRRLVVYYPVPGHPWSVVLMVPNKVALDLAIQISTPILWLLLVIGGVGLAAVSIIALRVTRPAEELALAAQRISESNLDQAVVVSGEDEVGRAGQAFERMRQKLRARLSELNLLLNVSQSVSSNLTLEDALPPVLQGALSATQAAGARIVLAPRDDQLGLDGALTAFAAGAMAELMTPLDRGVLDLTRREGRAVIENLARARAVLDVAPVVGKVHTLVALPLKQEAMYYGALYLGYDKPHVFNETEANFLTTLAGQAAVAIANARLFDAAEQGRQRLAAILASTPDAVIVTDRNDRVLLLNPAAEAAFDLTGKPVIGRFLAEAVPNRDLVRLMHANGLEANTGEFEITTGRTLYASVSPIISADGDTLGQVCILRDVTHFKEVDLMKSEFVATVSHDLRAPLTFMRGYATMMPMVGTLNEKQNEFANKIIIGIEQMTKLIDDLLDLGRIEAGVGLAKEPCRLDEITQGIVEMLSPVAVNKGLHLTLEAPRNLPLVSGDPTLLRQAITNLVDNALKYTPSGGQVRVGLAVDGDNFRVAVSDTGAGIAPADQVHLFEKFFRVKQRGSTQVKGSGLGLAIVKSITERHGGRVWMESKLGKGSTFYMELPRESVNGAQA